MSEQQITLTTRDGHTVAFSCHDQCDVISAAEKSAILLPSLCREGGCGICLGLCTEGEYSLGSYNETMLTDEAIARREVLLCRTYPKTDLKIMTPYDYNQVNFGKSPARRAIITALIPIAERTVQLTLHWQDEKQDKAVEFESGQCMELEIPNTGIRRAYSLANTGNWRGELEFLIRLQPEGQFSGYLREQAAIGQELIVYGPSGHFGLHAERFNPAIFIAGGTGLAPFLSILRRLADWSEQRDIHLLFGVNTESELFYLDELQRLQQLISGFTFSLCVWQPSDNWSGFCGTPVDALEDYLSNHQNSYDIYLCGPPRLVNAASEIAFQYGIPAEQIFSEKFG